MARIDSTQHADPLTPTFVEIDGFRCYSPGLALDCTDYPSEGFDVTAEVEANSFWCRSRNRILRRVVERFTDRSHPLAMLDIGCGIGGVLGELRRVPHLRLTASDIYLQGLKYARSRFPDVDFIQLDAADMPFRNEFDVVGAFDVLEHIQADGSVMRGVHDALRPGGIFIITVPQYAWMWSDLDEIVFHKRRYSRSEVLQKLGAHEFEILFCSSFVTVLFPAMAASRLLARTGVTRSDAREAFASKVTLSPTANRVCDWVMRVDELALRAGVSLPFGGSLLVCCRRSSLAKSFDFVEDGIGGRRPDKRLAVLVVVRQITRDRRFQGGHVLEGPAPNALRRDLREESFDLIEPARAGRREMQVVARVAHKPPHHLRHFVGPVVVHDEVDLTGRRQLRVEPLEEFQKLLMAMPSMTLTDHLPRRDIQRRKQRGGAVANVVVGLLSREAGAHRQQRPRAIQGLDLALFVHRQHDGVIGRTQIKADDVPDFLDKLRVRRQLERVDAMRLQAERAPQARDRIFGQPCDVGHAARGPLGGVWGRSFEGAGDQLHHHVVGRFPWGARPRLVRQPFQTAHPKPFAPFADAVARRVHALRDRPVREAVGTGEHHPRPQRQPLRGLRAARPLLQRPAFVLRQQQRLVVASSSHGAEGTPVALEVQDFF